MIEYYLLSLLHEALYRAVWDTPEPPCASDVIPGEWELDRGYVTTTRLTYHELEGELSDGVADAWHAWKNG